MIGIGDSIFDWVDSIDSVFIETSKSREAKFARIPALLCRRLAKDPAVASVLVNDECQRGIFVNNVILIFIWIQVKNDRRVITNYLRPLKRRHKRHGKAELVALLLHSFHDNGSNKCHIGTFADKVCKY